MCNNCKVIEKLFDAANSNPHLNYMPVYFFLQELLRQKRIEIYAGDCPFENALEVLNSEVHYTVCFYLRCIKCDDIYFFGACIRGKPVYKKINNIYAEKIENMIWGREGIYFEMRW